MTRCFIIPEADWVKNLADVIDAASDGDTIVVDMDAKKELAARAASPKGKTLKIEIRPSAIDTAEKE